MKKIATILLFGLAGLLVVAVTRRQEQAVLTTLRGSTMGTTYTVRLAARLAEPDRQRLQRQIQTTLDRVNAQMSTYQPDSEP